MNASKITPKKPATFRLNETTLRELADLAKRYKVSQADVIAVITHVIYSGWDLDQIDDFFEISRMS